MTDDKSTTSSVAKAPPAIEPRRREVHDARLMNDEEYAAATQRLILADHTSLNSRAIRSVTHRKTEL